MDTAVKSCKRILLKSLAVSSEQLILLIVYQAF